MPMFSLDFGYRKSTDSSGNKSSFSRSSSDETLRGSLKREFGQPYYKTAVEAKGELDFGELELELFDSRYMVRGHKEPKWRGWCKPSCIPISIILVLIALVVILSLLDQKWEDERREEQAKLIQEWAKCRTTCKMSIVESLPEGIYFNGTIKNPSTYDAWLNLLELAENEIDIGAYYWTLQDSHETADQGRDIFKRLMEAGTTRGLKIRIAKNIDSHSMPNIDTKELEDAGAASVRSVNFTRLIGDGILHTKIWVVDKQHAYIGSANLDWRSLTQVKELGVLITNCSCFAKDLQKIFEAYWDMGVENAKIPTVWPSKFTTLYNKNHEMDISFNDSKYSSFISSSPPTFCSKGRTSDLEAIFHVIDSASEFVHIAVMDYFPLLIYTPKTKSWPDIENRLRSAAIDRGVKVRLLMAKWAHTRTEAHQLLKSLQDLNGLAPTVDIQIKMFSVNSTAEQSHIPFARVNHNKYMVTEKSAYIGTSNWSGDYFVSTGGVGVVATPHNSSEPSVTRELAEVFERDWNSVYAKSLEDAFKDE